MSSFNSTKFKQLKAKWDKKLKESGFRDIENARGDLVDHKTGLDLHKLASFRPGVMESVRDYYYWATDMVSRGRFRSTVDKKIWKLHADGRSSREIAESVPFTQRHICTKIKIIKGYLLLQFSKSKD